MSASAALSLSTRWQKLWKLLMLTRAAFAAPMRSSIRSRSSRAALTFVGQDQEALRRQVRPRLQEVAHAFDDDAGLPRAGPGDDHDRPVPVLDDGPLRIGQWEVLGLGVSRRRYGDDAFPPARILSGGGRSAAVRARFPKLSTGISLTIYSLTRARGPRQRADQGCRDGRPASDRTLTIEAVRDSSRVTHPRARAGDPWLHHPSACGAPVECG